MFLDNLAHVQHAGVAVRLALAVLRPVGGHDGHLVHDDYVLALPRDVVNRLPNGQEKPYAVVGHPSGNGGSQTLALICVLPDSRVELFCVQGLWGSEGTRARFLLDDQLGHEVEVDHADVVDVGLPARAGTF